MADSTPGDRALASENEALRRRIAELEAQRPPAVAEITALAIRLASLPSEVDLRDFVIGTLMAMPGARGAVTSEYDRDARTLNVVRIEAAPGLLQKVLRLIGARAESVRSPVSPEAYRELVARPVGRLRTLTEVSFGAVPGVVSSAVQALVGADHFLAVAHVIEGELYGTSMVAMDAHHADPPEELLTALAHLVAISLRRRQAEEALKQSEARHRTVVDNIQEGVVVFSGDQKRYFNRRMAELIGVSPEEYEREPFLTFLHPEDQARVRAAFAAVLETGAPISGLELAAFTRGGQRRSFRARASRLDWLGAPAIIAFIEDLTAEKRAEERLRQSEERYRKLFDASPDGVVLIDRDGRITSVNRQQVRMLGCRAPEDLLGQHVTSMIAPSDRERATEIMRRRLAGEEIPTVEHELVRRDGSRFLGEVAAALLRGADGTVTGYICTMHDVTKRREAERRFQALVETTGDFIWEMDADGRYAYCSPQLQTLWGFEPEQMLGKSPFDLVPLGDREAATRMFGVMAAAGCSYRNLEVRSLDARGEVRHLEISGVPFLDAGGKVAGYRGITRDITERKRAEAALRESEARFRAVLENSNDGILLGDAGGVIHWRSPSYDRITGYPGAERLGRSGFEMVHPEDVERLKQLWAGVAGAAVPIDKVEYRIQHKDGGWRWVESSGQNLLANPDVCSVLITSRDITERKRAEVERARLEAQLQQAQKMEAVGQLAGGIAHDFNNILGAMTLQLNMLQLQPEVSPEELKQNVGDLLEWTSRATNLTRQLLLFGRQQPLKIARHEANKVVKNLMTLLGRLLGEDVSLSVDRCDEPLWFEGDAGMIEQVVTNLCVNARDAMPRGGRLAITTRAVELDEAAVAPRGLSGGRFVCLQVADTGSGIDAAVLEHIFEPFFTTKELGKGSGLGLATVHGIVAKHGGFVEVESRVGEGSRFSIFLRSAEPVEEVAAAPPRPAPQGTERVLVVEDEPGVRRLAVRCLRRLGYQVTEAESGPDALEVWSRAAGEFDLLFTDMVMPGGLSGLELASRLEAQRPGLRTIVASGYSAEVVERADAMEGVTFLPKPYDVAALAEAVRACLDRKR